MVSRRRVRSLKCAVRRVVDGKRQARRFVGRVFSVTRRDFRAGFRLNVGAIHTSFVSSRALTLAFSRRPKSSRVVRRLGSVIGKLVGTVPRRG